MCSGGHLRHSRRSRKPPASLQRGGWRQHPHKQTRPGSPPAPPAAPQHGVSEKSLRGILASPSHTCRSWFPAVILWAVRRQVWRHGTQSLPTAADESAHQTVKCKEGGGRDNLWSLQKSMTLTTSFFLFKLVSQVCWENYQLTLQGKAHFLPTLGAAWFSKLNPVLGGLQGGGICKGQMESVISTKGVC